MNARRFLFWACFIVILALIIWGLVVAMNKSGNPNSKLNEPAPITSADHVRGASTSPVTLIEYSDFQCPACESYYPLVTRLISEASSTMRLVYRHFPLTQHPNAIPAAIASEAANEQGQFWQMYDYLFTHHADWTELKDPTSVFVRYAGQLGLNVPKFTADLASSTLRDKVMASQNEGISIGINATPTFFINGKAISNPTSYEQFKALIDAAAAGGAQ